MKKFAFLYAFSLLLFVSLSGMEEKVCGICKSNDDRSLIQWSGKNSAHKSCFELVVEKDDILLSLLDGANLTPEAKSNFHGKFIQDLDEFSAGQGCSSIKALLDLSDGEEIVGEFYNNAINELTQPSTMLDDENDKFILDLKKHANLLEIEVDPSVFAGLRSYLSSDPFGSLE